MYTLYSVSGPTYAANLRIASVDTDVEEMIDAGIHITIAAGNRSNKIDVSGGTDYNNSFTSSGVKYYHRGSSPHSQNAFMVGNMDSTSANSTTDQKVQSSETGPGVDIYAPGTNIMSCTSITNKFTDASYALPSYNDDDWRQCNIGGTSMAAPQVAGVIALHLQLNPTATPAEIKSTILADAGTAILNTGTENDWTNDRSLKGGDAKVLFNRFNKAEGVKFQNLSSNFITNGLKLTTK
jgi:subtilisin family serine protease